jgi:serine/threonine-protein kinase
VPLRDVMPSVPEPIAAVVMRALVKDPASRPAGAEQLGIELAEAATQAWGTGWLNTRSGVAVMAAGEIVAVTERATAGAPPTSSVVGPAPSTIAPPPAAAPVRPSVAAHAAGAAANVVEEDVVPVQAITTPPRSAAPMLLAALALFVLVIAAAFAGIGAPSRDKAGTGILVNGKDPGASTLSLDLSEPLQLTGVPAGTSVAATVGGVSFVSADAAPALSTEQQVDLSGARYLIGGEATLEFTGNGISTRKFAIKSSQSGFLTAPAIGAIVLLLFALAYAESLSKPLRRGRRRVAAIVGVAVMGAIVGVAFTLGAWLFGAPETSVPGIVVGTVLGALVGVCVAHGELRLGQRRRLRRATGSN